MKEEGNDAQKIVRKAFRMTDKNQLNRYNLSSKRTI